MTILKDLSTKTNAIVTNLIGGREFQQRLRLLGIKENELIQEEAGLS